MDRHLRKVYTMRKVLRKTVRASTLTEIANRLLASPSSTRDERVGVIVLLESSLLTDDAYRGYNYLDAEQIGFEGVQPGIRPERGVTNQFADTDNTRRIYL
jgi:hypothetical protein